ncbi:Transposable element Tc1 transposase [Anabarilius grahami]|uniref:Transposable element Tc1 transposase n=1 Tax=Anabarilius grahami TaxID=495550 RepID=A0A3N0Y638_ANAGA|nr:Transposable element Tc1 transposase [Anabarilius grahami]
MNPGFHCTGQMADSVYGIVWVSGLLISMLWIEWPMVAVGLCSLEAENIPVLAWPAYSPDMAPIEHVWDALDRRKQHRVPVPANIQQLRTAIEEEWTNIPQASINNLINSMRRRCVALREANGGQTAYFRVAFYCGQPKATCAIIMLFNQHLDMPHL